MPRGRPRTRPIEDGAAPKDDAKPVQRRGPAKKNVSAVPAYDSYSETKSLLSAILRTRGDRGATPEILENVLSWARSVRTEGSYLKDLTSRQRRPKTSVEPDRILKSEMNRALLDGVLEGKIMISVGDDGTFSFAHPPAITRGFPEIGADLDAVGVVTEGEGVPVPGE